MLDYKAKYKELRAKMIESTDVAYRLGMADGMKLAQQQAQMQQMQQMQQAMMQPQIDPATGQPIQGGAPMGGDPAMGGAPAGGMPMDGGMGGMPADPNMMMPAGTEVGDELMPEQEQGELDSYIQELEDLVSKGQKPNVTDLRKKVTELADLRKSQKAKIKDNQPKVVAAQKKLVNGILQKWEKESKMSSENLENVLKESGLKIK